MNIKHTLLTAIILITGLNMNAQDLRKSIPDHAQFVVAFNHKAIIKNSSTALLTQAWAKAGLFDHAADEFDLPVASVLASNINLDEQAYVYYTRTDSVYYMGFLLPLKSNHQVQDELFSKFQVLPDQQGYQRRVSSDGKTQVAWNQNSVLILTGDVESEYFNSEMAAERYGIDLGDYASEGEWQSYDFDEEDAWAVAEEAEADSVTYEDYWEIDEEEQSDVTEETEELEDGTSEDNWDEYYAAEEARTLKNDSIKNVQFIQWLGEEIALHLTPQYNLANNKTIDISDQKTLVRLWVPSFDQLYQKSLTNELLEMVYGANLANLQYGYKEVTLDIIQDKQTLKIAGQVELEEQTAALYKAIYNNKSNKKFAQYIPDNLLGYASMNVSTEGYLEQLPTLISRYYGPLLGPGDSSLMAVAATALDITLDKKGISNVLKGDQVFFLNDLNKVPKEYISYDYDEDYNIIESTKTKDIYMPGFLWILTSEDHRLFKSLLAYFEKEGKVLEDQGIYTFEATSDWDPIYLLFKKDMIFVGSDREQITSIRQNRFNAHKNSRIKRDIRDYPLNMVLYTNRLPEVLDQLEIPLDESVNQTVQELASFGKLQVNSNPIKGKHLSGEISLALPNKDKSALQYILNILLKESQPDDIH